MLMEHLEEEMSEDVKKLHSLANRLVCLIRPNFCRQSSIRQTILKRAFMDRLYFIVALG